MGICCEVVPYDWNVNEDLTLNLKKGMLLIRVIDNDIKTLLSKLVRGFKAEVKISQGHPSTIKVGYQPVIHS